MKDTVMFVPTWVRGGYMFLFILILWVVRFAIIGITIFQFGSMVLTGQVNERLVYFGERLGLYAYQIVRFLTYNTEEKPFPFAEWPE